jgi:methionyl-tRNA formyltransferase
VKSRTVFFGTPAFAVPALDVLAEYTDVAAVVCQPDKPQGRGLTLQAPPVKQVAIARGIPCMQPTKLRTGEFSAWLRSLEVELAVVVAYGRILPQDVLDAPKRGCVNLHASLLPAYRGAAPIAWSVWNDDAVTGVTLMQLDAGMDTGPMLAHTNVQIAPNDTTQSLSEKLAVAGAMLLKTQLDAVLAGALTPEAQDHARATLAPMLAKSHGLLDFRRTARELAAQVRATQPWPVAHAHLRGKRLAIHEALALPGAGVAGTIVQADKSALLVATGTGLLQLLRVQPDGKRVMTAAEWLAGRGAQAGDVFEPAGV